MSTPTHKPIIYDSIDQMIADPNIVRLTFLTTFFHSMIVILLIILNLNKLFVQNIQSGFELGKIPQFIVQQINSHHVVMIFIVVTIILFLLYSIIYPIGQASLIHYLHYKKWLRHSLRASLKYFYPMFEFGFFSSIFSTVTYFWITFKVFFLNQSPNLRLLLPFVLWFLLMTYINKLKVYTRYFIVIDNLPLYEALRNSFSLAFHSLKSTSQYMRMQGWLLVNFSINLLLLVWIPLLVVHLAIAFNAISFWYVKLFVYLLVVILAFAGAYMSSFIRAFFAYYWYDIFMKLKSVSKE